MGSPMSTAPPQPTAAEASGQKRIVKITSIIAGPVWKGTGMTASAELLAAVEEYHRGLAEFVQGTRSASR